MVPSLESLGIPGLSVEERLVLIQRIWDSIGDAGQAVPLSDAQREELDRRMEDHRQNPHEGASWESVRDAALRRLRK